MRCGTKVILSATRADLQRAPFGDWPPKRRTGFVTKPSAIGLACSLNGYRPLKGIVATVTPAASQISIRCFSSGPERGCRLQSSPVRLERPSSGQHPRTHRRADLRRALSVSERGKRTAHLCGPRPIDCAVVPSARPGSKKASPVHTKPRSKIKVPKSDRQSR